MLNLLIKGGPIMIVLGLCSFYGCYIVIQKLLFFKSNLVQKDRLTHMITQHLERVGKPATIEKLSQSRFATHRILASSLTLSDQPYAIIQDTVQQNLPTTAPELDQSMAVLSSIITITPILGLLGTVIGLIDIFNVLSGGPINDTQQLSGGIAQALITTVTGLSITIPLVIMYRIIEEKAHRYRHALDACVRDVIEACNQLDA